MLDTVRVHLHIYVCSFLFNRSFTYCTGTPVRRNRMRTGTVRTVRTTYTYPTTTYDVRIDVSASRALCTASTLYGTVPYVPTVFVSVQMTTTYGTSTSTVPPQWG